METKKKKRRMKKKERTDNTDFYNLRTPRRLNLENV